MHISNPFDDSATALATKTASLAIFLLLANVTAWIAAAVAFAGSSILVGTGVLAYALGLRHAVDADHIAAIDNVVCKLVQDGKRPLSTGFFFSLGHSTVVVLASVGITAAATAMPDYFGWFHTVSGPIGTIASATFLLVIGVANLLVLRTLWRMVGHSRGSARPGAESLDEALADRGFFARLLGPVLRAVSRSWHLFPIGVLFGLGFDTATEIGLLGISATQAVQGLSFWQIMLFPALFTAGMTLVDTADSVLMTRTYGWANGCPERKLWYNFALTALSAAIAFSIGGIEALGLVQDRLDVAGPIWRIVGSLPGEFGNAVMAVVACFAATSVIFFVIFRRRLSESLPRSSGSTQECGGRTRISPRSVRTRPLFESRRILF